MYSMEQLYQIELGARAGVDVSVYKNEALSSDVMKQIRLGLRNGVDLSDLEPGYTADQIREIHLGRKQGLNTKVYENPKLSEHHMHLVRSLLLAGKPLDGINLEDFDHLQLQEICLGALVGVDYHVYANKRYTSDLMQVLRCALVDGCSGLAITCDLPSSVVAAFKELEEKGIDFPFRLQSGCSVDRLLAFALTALNGLPTDLIDDDALLDAQVWNIYRAAEKVVRK